MYKKSPFLLLFILLLWSCAPSNVGSMEHSSSIAISTVDFPNETKAVYNWFVQMQLPNGLIESTEDSNFVSLYDNSLAALVFISQKDYNKAAHIFDFFESKISSELLNTNGGFYQFRDKSGNNGNRKWLGDNAWLLIALNRYHLETKSRKYNYLASKLNSWIRSLQDSDGGLWGGYKENGTRIHKITEGVITAFNAIEGYDEFHINLLKYIEENRWEKNKQLIVAWPENSKYNHAMDLHSLAYSIFEDFPVTALSKADRYLNTQTITTTGKKITGFCFDEDKDVVWLEGTAQMATAYNKAGENEEGNIYIKEIEKAFVKSTLYIDAKGLPYTANYGSSYENVLLWDNADTAAAVSSSAWYLFAKFNFNPLENTSIKNIPAADKFWTITPTEVIL